MFATALILSAPTALGAGPLAMRDLTPFAALDAEVRRLPLPSPRTFATVAKGLIALSPSPLQKARAAYVWTTAHVAYSLARRGDGAAALADLSGDCEAHTAIYAALCKSMGVECATVGGHVRFGVPPAGVLAMGAKPLGTGQWLVVHAWNAVRIDGRWGLVDTTLGVKPTKDACEPDDYFLADPAVLATDHVPEDPAMRLAEAPVDLAHTPLLKPLAWRSGFEAADFVADARMEGPQLVLRPRLAWRRGMRSALQTGAGSLPNGVLVQPGATGTEIRLCPPGAAIVWLGTGADLSWHPLVGYAVTGSTTRRLPVVMNRFYDTGASLQGPFDRELASGATTEIRLKAPGASQVVAFQGQDVAGSFVREGDSWVLKTQPNPGANLEVMAAYEDPEKFQGLVTYDVH